MFSDLFLYLVWLIYFFGVISFCSLRKHLLLTLLSLEFLSMCLYLVLFSFLFTHDFSYYFLLVYLVFIVCEGALGLGILVSMIRSHGNDHISGLSILSW
uniref:NADH-ubiquinone oxidoreductase chain 4L n=1 Tax=Phalantus geniculatus TaxID=1524594 RepID=A0A6B9ISJ4_9HEMI|nr:NADH dehydrogenase subunit 4L [Phalantus geniculatus]